MKKKKSERPQRKLSTAETIEFLENFRAFATESSSKTKLISLKIPESMLISFKRLCESQGLRYQTQIKKLMSEWLRSQNKS